MFPVSITRLVALLPDFRPTARWRALVACGLAVLGSCGGTSPDPLPPDDDLRILFIGNSLTYVNDLPGMVERMATAVTGRAPVVQSVTAGDFSLEDHWNRGEAQGAIAADKWDFVVLQQGPSALPESRRLLVEYTEKFAGPIRNVGGRPSLYMVWPDLSRESAWDSVSQSYAVAARDVHGVLFPVGEAIRDARARDPGLTLFAGDGFHPAEAATYLAALVIYARATNRSPVGISAIAHLVDLSPAAIATLEAAAADALVRYPSP